MILNRTGAEFEYEGVTYTIGGAIVGTAESEYAGLYGRINAIHDGEDKETENETPDIYCEFDPPVMPHEVKTLEETMPIPSTMSCSFASIWLWRMWILARFLLFGETIRNMIWQCRRLPVTEPRRI